MSIANRLVSITKYITGGFVNATNGVSGDINNDTSGNAATTTTASSMANGSITTASFASTAKAPLAGVADSANKTNAQSTYNGVNSFACLKVTGVPSNGIALNQIITTSATLSLAWSNFSGSTGASIPIGQQWKCMGVVPFGASNPVTLWQRIS